MLAWVLYVGYQRRLLVDDKIEQAPYHIGGRVEFGVDILAEKRTRLSQDQGSSPSTHQ
jgi:hypothetical protein